MASDKPANVLNLDAFKSEVETKPLPVNLGGKLFHLTHADDLDGFDVLDNFIQGDVASTKGLLELALGDQLKEFRGKRPTKAHLDALIERYLEHCGMSTGKSDD